MKPLDPILQEVYKNLFQGIVDEAGQMIMRAAHTVFIKETQDFVVTLATPDGEAFAASRRIGIWLAIGMPLRSALEAVGTPREGDVYITNDPEATRGLVTHLPDTFVWRPVFYRGELVCYAVAFVHLTDVGGLAPGSVQPSAAEQLQEGLIIPPTRLVSEGQLNEELLALMGANCRSPEQNRGDVRALLGAVNNAAQRLLGLIDKEGLESVRAGMSGVLDYAETQAREVFRTIPDGTYTFADYLEGDVVPDGRPIRIKLDLVARDGALTLDFSATDPQVRAALNIPTYGQPGHYLIVIGLVSFLRSVNPDVTYNSGLVRPVRLVAPRGSLLNPEAGAPCGARQATFFRVAEVVMGALAQAIPERIPAAGCGQGSILFVAVPDFTTGRSRVSIVQPLVGGSGGRPTMDGTDGVDFNTGFYRNIPSEVLESDMPVVVERYGLRPGSGGAGKFRGGMGLDYALTVLPPEGVLTSRGMERYVFQPWGREGGQPGANGRTALTTADGARAELGKIDVLRMLPRSTLEIQTAGGGGYGDPFARDPALVLADVLDGLVAPEQARQEYGVAIVESRVDERETARLRQGARPPRERFNFGPTRVAYDERWPDALQTALNRLTAGLAPAPRQYVRGRLIEAIEQRRARGERLDDTALGTVYQRVMDELEVPLLEAL
ncbi:MAG: hydantoinase B/oxoprolinase family protein [Candidatus Rokubacteria bacterium]|nr:hydantoinase B/oxoprolinase family protein [Candidatus Rokubacteria bacterium]